MWRVSRSRMEEMSWEKACDCGATPARWVPMSILMKMEGMVDEALWIASTEGSWAGWSIMRERPPEPRTLDIKESLGTAAGVTGNP
jgi:hypothetical protein